MAYASYDYQTDGAEDMARQIVMAAAERRAWTSAIARVHLDLSRRYARAAFRLYPPSGRTFAAARRARVARHLLAPRPPRRPWTRAEVDGEILLTCAACGYVHRYAAGDREMVAEDITYCVGCGRP